MSGSISLSSFAFGYPLRTGNLLVFMQLEGCNMGYASASLFAGNLGGELIGLGIHAILFGFSCSTSFLCLYYLFRNWRPTASHYITLGFTIILSGYNIVVMSIRLVTTYWNACEGPLGGNIDIRLSSSYVLNETDRSPLASSSDIILSYAFLPVFLWLSDAFLLYRAWIIWIFRRKATIIPGCIYLASIAVGLVPFVHLLPYATTSNAQGLDLNTLEQAQLNFLPPLALSLGLDVVITGMIAGRLIYYHNSRQKMVLPGSSPSFLPVMIIFVESAVLSVISKIVQLTLEQLYQGTSVSVNPFVIPLCVLSSNFIVLRKALGADVIAMIGHRKESSTLYAHSHDVRLSTGVGFSDLIAPQIRTIFGTTVGGASGQSTQNDAKV